MIRLHLNAPSKGPCCLPASPSGKPVWIKLFVLWRVTWAHPIQHNVLPPQPWLAGYLRPSWNGLLPTSGTVCIVELVKQHHVAPVWARVCPLAGVELAPLHTPRSGTWQYHHQHSQACCATTDTTLMLRECHTSAAALELHATVCLVCLSLFAHCSRCTVLGTTTCARHYNLCVFEGWRHYKRGSASGAAPLLCCGHLLLAVRVHVSPQPQPECSTS